MQHAWATGTSRALFVSNTVGRPAVQAVSKTQKAHGVETTNSWRYMFTLIQKQSTHSTAAVQMANWTVQLKRLNTHHSDWLHIKDPSARQHSWRQHLRREDTYHQWLKCKITAGGTLHSVLGPWPWPCVFPWHYNNLRWGNALSHKLEMGEWRSLATHYTLTTAYHNSIVACQADRQFRAGTQ